MISFINSLFNAPEQLLNQAIAFLANLATVSAAGINVNDYFSWLGVLDPSWESLISSIVASLMLIGALFLARAVYRAYLSLKQGIMWW